MQEPVSWLEISLVVDGEMAEAVAEVLARFVPNGVVVETTRIEPQLEGEGIPAGPLRVCGYLRMDPGYEDVRRRLEESLWYLGRIRPLPEPRFRIVEQQDWSQAWKSSYRPISVGQRLLIQPAWLESVPGDRAVIRIDPGMAFGTGTHPTTQLCLEFVERFVQPDRAVIDVGCGSGILSIAALKLGASHALGVDIDPQALEAARTNALENGVQDRLELGVGSLEAILQGEFSVRQASLVLANILAPVIARLIEAGLVKLLAPGGVLVLSGILDVQLDGGEGHIALLPLLERHNLKVLEQRQVDDWIALAVTGQ